MDEHPNDASRKSKAEGERWSPDSEHTRDRSEFQSTDERSGLTNRSQDEEMSTQEVPSRGQSRRGESDVDMDMDTRRSER
jgi:hypothetical protein